MKKAIILGCSHAAGAEIDLHDAMRGYEISYPALIAKGLGYEPENHAMYGGSNDSMFRIFLEQLPRLTSDDIVIACWTGSARTEIYHEIHEQWVQITPNSDRFNVRQKKSPALQGHFTGQIIEQLDEYVEYTKIWQRLVLDINEINSRTNKIKNILSLNSIAQQKMIQVLNFQSFDPRHDDWCLIEQFKWPVGNLDFMTWADQNGYIPNLKKHYGHDAHRAYADIILQNLVINYP